MPTEAFKIPLLAALLLIAGCADSRNGTSGNDAAPAIRTPIVTPTSQPTGASQDSRYVFDDPRCSPAQRQAIRAATQALTKTAALSPEALPYLHNDVWQADGGGWFVTVWDYGPGHPPAPGGFTDVQLDRDFAVVCVTRGA
jgi:hypothetical protein